VERRESNTWSRIRGNEGNDDNRGSYSNEEQSKRSVSISSTCHTYNQSQPHLCITKLLSYNNKKKISQ
jgi:hypothetical protein